MANDKDLTRVEYVVFLCNGGGCQRRGAEAITAALRARIAAWGQGDRVHTIRTRCVNPCEHGPVVIVYPGGVWYGPVTPDAVPALVDRHLIEGKIVAPLAFHTTIPRHGASSVGPNGEEGSHAG